MTITRRDVLAGAVAVGAGFAPVAKAFSQESLYRPFHMGVQSYSLRGYALDRALKEAKALGVDAWEVYPGHMGRTTDPAEIQRFRALHKDAGVKCLGWGVVSFSKDEKDARTNFDFARAMGIKVISADPSEDSFDLLEKLVKEFDIRIAIHNHGPGARFSTLGQVAKAVEGKDWRIGSCIDTGHALRSGEDPVVWTRTLGKRVHGVHLKDVKDAKTFTVLGEGDLRLDDFIRELRKLKFDQLMSLEYEEKPEDPRADMRQCLLAVQKAIKATARP